MTWFAAFTTGAGVGLAYCLGLWLTVRRLVQGRRARSWPAVYHVARLALVGLVFFALSQHGLDILLIGFAGFWTARWHIVRRMGGALHEKH